MPTGLTTAWGYPIDSVANRYQTMVSGNHPLTYELGLSSYPPSFVNGEFQSPLTSIAQKNKFTAFGKRKSKRSKKSKKSKIPAKIRRLCKRLKIKMTRKVGRRRVAKSLKQLKKQIRTALKKKKLQKKKR